MEGGGKGMNIHWTINYSPTFALLKLSNNKRDKLCKQINNDERVKFMEFARKDVNFLAALRT